MSLNPFFSFLGLRSLQPMAPNTAEVALFFDQIPTSSFPTLDHCRTTDSTCGQFPRPRPSLPLSAFLWVFDWFSLPFHPERPAMIDVRIRQFVAWDTESHQISWIIHQIQIKTMFAGFESLDTCSADDMMLVHEPLEQTDFTYPPSHLTSVKQERVNEGLF